MKNQYYGSCEICDNVIITETVKKLNLGSPEINLREFHLFECSNLSCCKQRSQHTRKCNDFIED